MLEKLENLPDHSLEVQAEEEKGDVDSQEVELMDLPVEALSLIFSFLPPSQILTSVTQVSGLFASACEPCFQDLCKTHGWKMPRRPRGGAAEAKVFPWRSLFRQHVCRNCGEAGDFFVRRGYGWSAPSMLLCRRCVSKDRVRDQLVKLDASVDLVGISGKKLLRKEKKRKVRTLA